EKEQARLAHRTMELKLSLVLGRPALSGYHQDPQARGDAVGVELPGNARCNGEITRPKSNDDRGDDAQHIKRRARIGHLLVLPPLPHGGLSTSCGGCPRQSRSGGPARQMAL